MPRLLSREESIERLPEISSLASQKINPELFISVEELSGWIHSHTYFIRCIVDDNNNIQSYLTTLVTYREHYEELLAGKRKEIDLAPFRPESAHYEKNSLYIAEVVVQNSPDLVRLSYGVLKDMKAFSVACDDVGFDHYFAIAQNDLSSRMLRKSGFTVAGQYEGADVLSATRKDLPVIGHLVP